jgi:hypothetical protein
VEAGAMGAGWKHGGPLLGEEHVSGLMIGGGIGGF